MHRRLPSRSWSFCSWRWSQALRWRLPAAPHLSATPMRRSLIDRRRPPPNPPRSGKTGGALPPVARPATVPVSSPDGIDTSGAVIEIDPALRRPNLMVFEQLFRSSPRRRASPCITEGFSPTARAHTGCISHSPSACNLRMRAGTPIAALLVDFARRSLRMRAGTPTSPVPPRAASSQSPHAGVDARAPRTHVVQSCRPSLSAMRTP